MERIKDKRGGEKNSLQTALKAQPSAALVVTSFNTPAQQEREREMLDEVVGKENGAKGRRRKERQLSSLLLDQRSRAARESRLLWCVFGGLRL